MQTATCRDMGPNAEHAPLLDMFPFRLLQTQPTDWTSDQAVITLNARMDARLVPSPASPDGTPTARSCALHDR